MAPKLHVEILSNLTIKKKNQKQFDLLICHILPDNSPFLARLFLPGSTLISNRRRWNSDV